MIGRRAHFLFPRISIFPAGSWTFTRFIAVVVTDRSRSRRREGAESENQSASLPRRLRSCGRSATWRRLRLQRRRQLRMRHFWYTSTEIWTVLLPLGVLYASSEVPRKVKPDGGGLPWARCRI